MLDSSRAVGLSREYRFAFRVETSLKPLDLVALEEAHYSAWVEGLRELVAQHPGAQLPPVAEEGPVDGSDPSSEEERSHSPRDLEPAVHVREIALRRAGAHQHPRSHER